jgi:hypothetical protein
MSADHYIPLPGLLKLLDGIAVKECINAHGDCVSAHDIGFHPKLRLPIESSLPMIHLDAERQTEEIAVNFGIKPLGDVLFFLIRLREDQLSGGNKFLYKGPQVRQPINFNLLQFLPTLDFS